MKGEEGEFFGVLKPGGMGLREYQIKIAETVLRKGNSLVVMPTALGKTFVAVLVMARILDGALHGKRKGKALFMAPTRPLVAQQAKRFEELLQLRGRKVAVLSGETAPKEREKAWNAEENLVFCATPQTVEYDMLAGRLDLRQVCLVIVDEAHRAVKEYAYSFVAREARKHRALLLGLTASPSSNLEKISEVCGNLGVKNVEIRDEEDADVKAYANKIRVELVVVGLPNEFREIMDALEDMLEESLVELKELGYIDKVDLRKHKRGLLEAKAGMLKGVVGADKVVYAALSLQAKAMNVSHALELIETEGLHALNEFIKQMRHRKKQSKAVRQLLSDYRLQTIELRCEELLDNGTEHPKFKKLKELLSQELKPGKSAIVFAQYRNTVRKITRELKGFGGVRAVELVGKSRGMTQKKQLQVLQEFREGEHNVLVSTAVGEEGLDIPRVDFVVFFEAVPSEIRAIQRRGRTGRTREGKVVVLATRGGRDEAFYWAAMKKEKKMKKVLWGLREHTNATRETQKAQTSLVSFT